MFWFIVAAVFFILWLVEKKKAKDALASDSYDKGYREGHQALKSKIQSILDSKGSNEATIRRVLSLNSVDRSASKALRSVDTLPERARQLPEKDSQADKEARSIKNLNTLLFVASLLFVAAGVAFVATSMPEVVKLVGVWLLVAMFYCGGLALHKSEKLKIAGVSFIGTSLGIIPFAGLALYQLTDLPGAVVWLITSLVGVGAYLVAALRLQNQVVAYLTMAFVVSLAASLSESVSLPLMWSFVLMIGVSVVATVVAMVRSTWVPQIFSKPIERTGQLVTPIALAASLVLFSEMSVLSYEVVFGMATIHYIVAWLQSRQFMYETLSRILFHITLLIVAGDVLDDMTLFGIAFVGIAVLQQGYSLLIRPLEVKANRITAEKVWIIVMQFLQFAACIFWFNTPYDVSLSVAAITIVGLASVGAMFRFSDVRMGIGGLVASMVLPIVVARLLFEPALDWGFVALWFTGAAAVVLLLRSQVLTQRSRSVKQFFSGSFTIYASMATIVALFIDELPSGVLLMVLAACVWVASYVVRFAWVSLVGNLIFFLSVSQLLSLADLRVEWFILALMWITGGVFYIGHHLLLYLKDEKRAEGLLGSVWLVILPSTLLMFSDTSDSIDIWAAVTIMLGAASIAAEGHRRKSKGLVETAMYVANLGILRIIGILLPGLNMVFYAHWIAAVIILAALWRGDFTRRLMVATGFITASSGLFALGEGGWYQLLFLVEHLALLVAGALTARRWATWWGLIASCLAILYFLRDVAFLAFGFLGLVIIGVVVWRLTRPSGNSNDPK